MATPIVYFEPPAANTPAVRAAGVLYERVLDADERIPWAWLERSVNSAATRKPGGWMKHLILAAPADAPDATIGFVFGAHIPGFGGYVGYLGVDESARGRGVGAGLFAAAFRAYAADAASVNEPLPFVAWESHRPQEAAPPAAHSLWESRVKLFARVGGLWADGVELQTPNYDAPDGPPVPLELFAKPVAAAAADLDPRHIAAGLLMNVYKASPGDAAFAGTFPPGCKPRFRPAAAARGRPLPA